MATIIKCPACGALWRLDEKSAGEPQYRCGGCGRVFEAGKAERLTVPDAELDRLTAEARAAEPEDVPPMPSAADARPTAEFSADPHAAVYVPKRSPVKAFLFLLVLIVCTCAACASAFLMMHEFVLAQAPFLRPVYENVCSKVPCPGFVWRDASAFRTSSTLAEDPELGFRRPVLNATILNASAHPQALPVLEVKLLDPAGEVLVTSVLEPAQYGFPQKPAVLPAGESVKAEVRFKTTLPHDASEAAVRPVAADEGR